MLFFLLFVKKIVRWCAFQASSHKDCNTYNHSNREMMPPLKEGVLHPPGGTVMCSP
jgi:hypothetical protein